MLDALTLGVSICRQPGLLPDQPDGLLVDITNTCDEMIDGLNVWWSYGEPYVSMGGKVRHRTRVLGFTYETDQLPPGASGQFLIDGKDLREILNVIAVASPDAYQLVIAADDFEEAVDSQQFAEWLEAEFADIA